MTNAPPGSNAVRTEDIDVPSQPPTADFLGANPIRPQPALPSIAISPPGSQDLRLGDWWEDFTADESWAFLQSMGMNSDVNMQDVGNWPPNNGAGPSQQGGAL